MSEKDKRLKDVEERLDRIEERMPLEIGHRMTPEERKQAHKEGRPTQSAQAMKEFHKKKKREAEG